MSARSRAALCLTLVALALSGGGGRAWAQDLKDRFNARVSLSGMYLREDQEAASDEARQAATFQLGYGDLRVVLDGRRLPGKFELHLDGWIRLTGNFSQNAASQGAGQVTSRGYLGGREYAIRELWTRRRGARIDFALGRMIVVQADALRLDGGRLWVHLGRHWDLSLFAGSYPDPYSRSLLTDYVSNGFGVGGGAATTYTYDRLWGSLSATGLYLSGTDDGGPFDPAVPAGNFTREGVRAYLTWTNFGRLTSWLDLYHDLVVDVAGSGGPQLTRLDVLASGRLGKHFTLRLAYDRMSSIAVEMFLVRLLNNRNGFLPNTIENNLIVQRTAHDQGRLQADFTYNRTSIFAEGRLRYRSLLNGGDDPQFVNMDGSPVAPRLAYDATLGVRDRGSLKGIRAGLYGTYLQDYRNRSFLVGLQLGRSFLAERLTLDGQFLYANTKDSGAGSMTPCNPAAPSVSPLMNTLTSCFGTRSGADYELGLTITGAPFSHWFAYVDYRLVIDTNDAAPAIFTHLLLARIEARY